MSVVQEVVSFEPWRTGQGQPRNALDPTWPGYTPALCNGAIEWEGISRWWWCTQCGYCGFLTRTEHYPVQTPLAFFLHGVVFFFRRRVTQGMPAPVSAGQALFTAGVALRYAAATPPNQLGRYVQNMTQ